MHCGRRIIEVVGHDVVTEVRPILGWINRNRININGAPHLITVPLKQASQNKLICEISVDDDLLWRDKLLKTIRQAYSRA